MVICYITLETNVHYYTDSFPATGGSCCPSTGVKFLIQVLHQDSLLPSVKYAALCGWLGLAGPSGRWGDEESGRGRESEGGRMGEAEWGGRMGEGGRAESGGGRESEEGIESGQGGRGEGGGGGGGGRLP